DGTGPRSRAPLALDAIVGSRLRQVSGRRSVDSDQGDAEWPCWSQVRLRPRTRRRFFAIKREPTFLLFRQQLQRSLLHSWRVCLQNSLRIDQGRLSGPFKKWSLIWPTMSSWAGIVCE